MYGTARASGYGYSLYEFKVFTGSVGPTTTPPTGDPAPEIPGNFTTVWTDGFDGPANTSPSAANWLMRTGTQYPGGAANWGTGEVETASNSTANVYLDGAGKLNIKAIRDGGGNWTSGRIETQRTDFEPRAGELTKFSAVLKQPDVANGLGYWPGFRATGAAYRGNYNNWPGVGETDIMTDVNGRSQLAQTLHCGTAPDGVVRRVQRTLQRPGELHRLPDRVPRVHPDHRPDQDRRGDPLLPRRPADLGRARVAGRRHGLERGRAPRLLPAPRPGHRRLAAERDRRLHHADRRRRRRVACSASTR